MKDFNVLGLSEALMKVLPEIGFETPTQIQKEAIPVLCYDKKDFIGLAQTGTGKTAAFGLPLLDAIDAGLEHTQALVLAPTRELGQQINQQLEAFSKYLPHINTIAVYGGAPITEQIRKLKNRTNHIIVATPGRLFDLMKRKVIDLQNIRFVILDEADEMLNMGFKEEIDKILSFTPQDKYTWLFSATMPREIRNIVHLYMKDPAEIVINAQNKVNTNITHYFSVSKSSNKPEALRKILDYNTNIRGIIFCRTKIDTQQLATELANAGYPAEALHGDLSQKQRDHVMDRFKSNRLQLLIATDVAARGIDVDDLSHIIHFDIPDNSEYYTHRSGRTARAGKDGVSLALVTKSEVQKIKEFERKLKINFEKVPLPSVEDIQHQRIEQWIEHIRQVKVSPELDFLEEELYHGFADMDKAILIKKIASLELEKIKYQDRTLKEEKGKKKKEKSGKSKKSSNRHRFFINIGEIDDIDHEDLQMFISERTKIKKENIGSISLREKHSYFEVDKKEVKKVNAGFKGIKIEGRKLRVNSA